MPDSYKITIFMPDYCKITIFRPGSYNISFFSARICQIPILNRILNLENSIL